VSQSPSKKLTVTDVFFWDAISKLADRLSLHAHIVRPKSSESTSGEDAMTAYVVQMWAPFSTVLRLTAGQENVVEGPRVCDTTGCRLDS
jgi:hypothetical protein